VHFDFDGDGRSDRAVPRPDDFATRVEVEHVFTTPGEHTVRFTPIPRRAKTSTCGRWER
jgi:hypothetical protein